MNIGTLHRRAVTTTGVLGVLGVVSGSPILVGSSFAAATALLAAGPRLHQAPRSAPLRRAVHAITGAGLLLTLIGIRRLGVDAVFIILMLGVVNRALLRAGHRDDLLIVGASATLLAAATVVTSGLAFAVLVVGFVPALVITLWTSMMLGGAEHDEAQRRSLASRPAPAGAGRLAVAGLGMMLIGFGLVALLPRYRFAGFLAAGAFASLPGAGDSMTLGLDGVPDRDTGTVMLRVMPGDGAQRGDLEGLYARQYVLDQFDGKTWSARTGGHYYAPRPAPSLESRVARVSVERVRATGVHEPAALLGRTAPWALLSSAVHLELGGTAVVDRVVTRTIDYEVAIGRDFDWPQLPRIQARSSVEVETSVPGSVDPRVRALAEQLTRGLATPEEKTRAVLAHFSRGFSYSLDPLEGDSADPLVRFLFESKRGHCELYAGAVAVLLRLAGVRARVATGYYLGRWNTIGGYLAFSDRDAHAWVEVLDGDRGWRWIDATPEDLRSRREVSVLTTVRDWYDALNALWFDHVVDFDGRRQRRLYEAISHRFDDLAARASEQWRGIGAPDLGTLGSASGSAGLLLLLLPLAVIGLVALVRQRRRPERLGRRLRCALGERAGENLPLDRLLDRSAQRELATRAVELYQRFRFAGDGQVSAQDARRAIAALERASRQAT
ncbi:MAG: DUF3488 domain-containing protein [Deltaproteobacteria bacterium]|nr:DUF3488 domain-containing protein [Deltaproteobacteria bacterium]